MFVFSVIWAGISFWLGVYLGYLIAAGFILGGLFVGVFLAGDFPLLAKPLRFVGVILMAIGSLVGGVNYGKSIGAADCEARWKAANYQAQIDELKREAQIKSQAADMAQNNHKN